MREVQEWQIDPDSPDGPPIIAPSSLAVELFGKKTTNREERRVNRIIESLIERGLLTGENMLDISWVDLRLTEKGYSRLDYFNSQKLGVRIKNGLLKVFDRVLASIVTPIIVSLLTVLALNHLGLSK